MGERPISQNSTGLKIGAMAISWRIKQKVVSDDSRALIEVKYI
jgi:hypothetical protein